jgi:uncharacterized protein (DUF488 family)
MDLYTIGFARKTAPQFFGALRQAGVKRLLDVRLNNTSQLAGFTKRDDLPFFLKEICGADYAHEPRLAPTAEILDGYKEKTVSWEEYERRFNALLAERRVEETLDRAAFAAPTVLLCGEPTAEHCHRRLVAEYLRAKWGDVRIVHL